MLSCGVVPAAAGMLRRSARRAAAAAVCGGAHRARAACRAPARRSWRRARRPPAAPRPRPGPAAAGRSAAWCGRCRGPPSPRPRCRTRPGVSASSLSSPPIAGRRPRIRMWSRARLRAMRAAQPRKRSASPLKRARSRADLQPGLRGDVLRVRFAHQGPYIAQQPGMHGAVDGTERRLVAGLRRLHGRRQPTVVRLNVVPSHGSILSHAECPPPGPCCTVAPPGHNHRAPWLHCRLLPPPAGNPR